MFMTLYLPYVSSVVIEQKIYAAQTSEVSATLSHAPLPVFATIQRPLKKDNNIFSYLASFSVFSVTLSRPLSIPRSTRPKQNSRPRATRNFRNDAV